MDKYNLIISQDVMNMLDSHAEFLARVSKSAARRLVDSILADIESLSELTERCPAYENQFVPRGRYRQLLSCKRYLIILKLQLIKCMLISFLITVKIMNDNHSN